MTKPYKMELTRQEMNVVQNGLSLLVGLNRSYPGIVGLNENAKEWYTKVQKKFEEAYIQEEGKIQEAVDLLISKGVTPEEYERACKYSEYLEVRE